MKEQSDLEPVVEKYKEYKSAKEGIADSLAILDEETDEEMRELAKEELNECKASVAEIEQELRILLRQKIPMMKRTLSSRFVRVPVEMRRHCLLLICTACIANMLNSSIGK